MTEIQIDVQGNARCTAPPELAVVSAAVTCDGPEPDQVRAEAVETLARVRPTIDLLREQGSVTEFAVDQVYLTSRRPRNEQGEQRPLVHTATVGLAVTFSDLSAIAAWILTPGLSVHYIHWRVGDQTRARLERQARQQALRDAVGKAQDYADTLGLAQVSIREISEPGDQEQGAFMAAAAPDLDLRPAPFEVSAQIHARFAVEQA